MISRIGNLGVMKNVKLDIFQVVWSRLVLFDSVYTFQDLIETFIEEEFEIIPFC